MKNQKWYKDFEDADFTRYIESGESWAVHIVRDCAEDVNTSGQWIDILSVGNFQKYGRNFRWIAAELFPRRTEPQYTADPYENRYLCWLAAHEDIAWYREKGQHGPKYLIIFEEKCRKFDNIEKPVKYWCAIGSKHIHQNALQNCRSAAEQILEQKRK